MNENGKRARDRMTHTEKEEKDMRINPINTSQLLLTNYIGNFPVSPETILESYKKQGILTSGSIILTEGRGYFTDELVKLFAHDSSRKYGSNITHITVVIGYKGILYNLESTSQPTDDAYPDLIQGIVKEGPMMVPFINRFKTYRGPMWIRTLKPPLSPFLAKIAYKFYKKVNNKIFERNLLELLNCKYKWLNITTNTKWTQNYFCSELVARMFQELGLLPSSSEGSISAKFHSPEDWISDIQLENTGKYLEEENNDYKLSDPVQLKRPVEYIKELQNKLN